MCTFTRPSSERVLCLVVHYRINISYLHATFKKIDLLGNTQCLNNNLHRFTVFTQLTDIVMHCLLIYDEPKFKIMFLIYKFNIHKTSKFR